MHEMRTRMARVRVKTKTETPSLGVEGARHDGADGLWQAVPDCPSDRLGGAQHSVQVRGGVSF